MLPEGRRSGSGENLQVINMRGGRGKEHRQGMDLSSWASQCDYWADSFTSDQSTGLVQAHNKRTLEPTIVFMPYESNLLPVMMSMYGLKEVYQ